VHLNWLMDGVKLKKDTSIRFWRDVWLLLYRHLKKRKLKENNFDNRY